MGDIELLEQLYQKYIEDNTLLLSGPFIRYFEEKLNLNDLKKEIQTFVIHSKQIHYKNLNENLEIINEVEEEKKKSEMFAKDLQLANEQITKEKQNIEQQLKAQIKKDKSNTINIIAIMLASIIAIISMQSFFGWMIIQDENSGKLFRDLSMIIINQAIGAIVAFMVATRTSKKTDNEL
jgi:ABC-type multidrug transport system fused ATPase/permease subunit